MSFHILLPPQINKDRLGRFKSSLKRAVKRSGLVRSPVKSDALVFGEGPCPSPVVIVGEAPGRTEAELGRPFVGRAGVFFTAIVEEAMGRPRGEFFITNVVKVWPHLDTSRGRTRPPSKAEFEFFLPFLKDELALLKPRVVVAVGKTAFAALAPGSDFSPGAWVDTGAAYRLMPIYHPAYLLRKQKSLDEMKKDMKSALVRVRKYAYGE